MKQLEKISSLAGKYMSIIVILVAAAALIHPPALNWIKTSWINYLLGIVMFGMGLTLKGSDFVVVFSRPKDVIIGLILQFTLMPAIAFVLTKVFQLPPELAIGVILVGTCPGGTSSNIMNYIAKADVPLSLAISGVSTLLAPVLTPLLTYLWAGKTVDVNMVSMFLSIVKVIILPIIAGLIINKLFGKVTAQLVKVLPLVSVIAVIMIVGAVVSANAAKILTSGLLIVIVVILHNLCGYGLGFGAAKLLRMSMVKSTTIGVEVGMQNSGLATTLAVAHFATMPMATIPGAVFSVWHNVSGSIFANIMAPHNTKEREREAAEKTKA